MRKGMATEVMLPSLQLLLRRPRGRPEGGALTELERVHVRAKGARTRARR
jgi:hypothetical protein